MYKTQTTQVIKQLRKRTYVSRNWALNRRITRLGAIIKDLCNSGWQFDDTESNTEILHGKFEDTRYGKRDYVYHLVSEPKKK